MPVRKTSLRTPAQRRREQERQFRPLAIEVGWITYEWNRLQEAMAELFNDALGVPSAVGLAVWHSVRSDLSQREMLKAAATYRAERASPEATLVWQALANLVNETNSQSNKRNDAVHVPLVFVTDLPNNEIKVQPMDFLGNPKAGRLATRELLTEFQHYRKVGAALADYAIRLHYAINHDGVVLPKLILPTRGQKPPSARAPRRKNPKSATASE